MNYTLNVLLNMLQKGTTVAGNRHIRSYEHSLLHDYLWLHQYKRAEMTRTHCSRKGDMVCPFENLSGC